MGHLTGTRVSALLDGQLSAVEAEQAWAHVHACHSCRDRVEREGWVKSRLAGLSGAAGDAPDHLRGSLHQLTPGERFAADPRASARELAGRSGGAGRGMAAVVGSGAAGAAMLGVLALGVAPASTPVDRRPSGGPTQSVSTTTPRAPMGPVAVAVTRPIRPVITSPTVPTPGPTTGTAAPTASTLP